MWMDQTQANHPCYRIVCREITRANSPCTCESSKSKLQLGQQRRANSAGLTAEKARAMGSGGLHSSGSGQLSTGQPLAHTPSPLTGTRKGKSKVAGEFTWTTQRGRGNISNYKDKVIHNSPRGCWEPRTLAARSAATYRAWHQRGTKHPVGWLGAAILAVETNPSLAKPGAPCHSVDVIPVSLCSSWTAEERLWRETHFLSKSQGPIASTHFSR